MRIYLLSFIFVYFCSISVVLGQSMNITIATELVQYEQYNNCSDCSGAPDPKWRAIATKNGSGQYVVSPYNSNGTENLNNIMWRNPASYSCPANGWITPNNRSWNWSSNTTQYVGMDIDGLESDGGSCGGDDNVCGGYGAGYNEYIGTSYFSLSPISVNYSYNGGNLYPGNNVYLSSYPPNLYHHFRAERNCPQAFYRVQWYLYWYYTSISGGNISNNANNQCVTAGGDPSAFVNTMSPSPHTTYVWESSDSTNGTWSAWAVIGGSTNILAYDPPSGLNVTRKYRRKTTWGSFTAYSNEVKVGIIPNNDNYTNAQIVTSTTGIAIPFCTTCANTSSGFILNCGTNSTTAIKDIWYKYQVPTSGILSLSISATNYNARIALFAPNNPNNSYDCKESLQTITKNVCANETYYICIGGINGSVGKGNLHVTFTSIPLNIGIISANISSCVSAIDPPLFTSVGDAGINTTTQWQLYPQDIGMWLPIPNAINATYDHNGNIATTTKFRKVVTDGCGITGASNEVTVGINPKPNLILNSINNPLCAGALGSAIFSVSPTLTNSVYTYSEVGNSSNYNTTGIFSNLLSNTIYNIVVTDGNNCTSLPYKVQLSAPSPVISNVEASMIMSCDPNISDEIVLTISASGGNPYIYSYSINGAIPTPFTNGNIEVLPPEQFNPNGYQISITDGNGCPSSIKEILTPPCTYSISQVRMSNTSNNDIEQKLAEAKNKEGIKNANIEVFPNPTQGGVIIAFQNWKEDEGLIVVSNSLGQMLLQKNIIIDAENKQFQLDISQYPIGIYIINITSKNRLREPQTFKVVRTEN